MADNLLSEEESLLRNTVRDYSNDVLAERAADYDDSGLFPWDNFKELGDMGLLGLGIGEEYGGSGGTTRLVALAAEEIARGCAATSVVYIAHLSLCTQFINRYGSEDQKHKYLPDLASGKKVGAFALTEPGAGSDAAAITTNSVRANGHLVVNGNKTYISNAPEASVIVTLVTRDHSLNHKGIDALIIDGDVEGITVNKLEGKMGVRASTVGEIIFDNCQIPAVNQMGGDGVGFRQTMEVLNASRISIAAQCVGIAQSALDASIEYAKNRKAFGGTLSDLQAIQWMVADMATETEAARQLVMNTASLRDAGLPFNTEASMAKLFASRVAMNAAYKAVQIHGGAGYFSPTPVERYFRDARVTEIYEGTSEIQKMVIARNILTG
ncbi:MAG: acyl-CoA dehydrogenase [SAR202 cluster bacterium]|nr:acyl-CoA dehydrogenase [SAR202 cluster bacterium]|tara:strand:- start:11734 stop:12879 length:1146 start_codon:yes stop_codon:yes gene_type:complete